MRFLRDKIFVIALWVYQTQNSYPRTLHSLEILISPPLLDMFIARFTTRFFWEKSGLQHRSKVIRLSRSHTLLRSKSRALWDLRAMAIFGCEVPMAAHAYWKCDSPSTLERLESPSLSSWWDCSALTDFFSVLICFVKDLIDLEDLLLKVDLCQQRTNNLEGR